MSVVCTKAFNNTNHGSLFLCNTGFMFTPALLIHGLQFGFCIEYSF